MNLPKLYTDLTTKPKEDSADVDKPKGPEPEEDAAHFQARMHWLASSITRELKTDNEKKANEYLSLAMSLADSYGTHRNPDSIINALVKARTLLLLNDSMGAKKPQTNQ